jgi:diacylglycerol O-acyltransferase
MRRVSGSDAIFLSTETPTAHMHVGGVTVLDPADAPDFSFDRVEEVLRARIPLAPKFTWRLKEVPFGFDLPVWVDDPHFDVAHHVRRIGLPSPGTMRELADLVGDIMSRPLDRRLPLWEIWLVEGLEGGRCACVMKFHHALVDGASGMGLTELLLDVEPDPPARELPPLPPPDLSVPSDLELLARAGVRMLGAPLRIGRYLVQSAIRTAAMLPYQRRAGVATPLDAPRVPWNGELGPRRALAFSAVPLADVRALKEHFDVKVNDVVLALTAGAVRRYLLKHDALPAKPLVAAVPISTRAPGDDEMANRVANMFVSLATHLDDPVERLQAIYRSTQTSKEMTRAIRAHEIRALGDTFSPMVLNLASRTIVATHLMQRLPAACNLVVSNVPGPTFPLYVCGARLVHMYATGPFLLGMGLNVTVISYLDSVDFGFHVDPDLVADPWYLADGVPEALEELKVAASA